MKVTLSLVAVLVLSQGLCAWATPPVDDPTVSKEMYKISPELRKHFIEQEHMADLDLKEMHFPKIQMKQQPVGEYLYEMDLGQSSSKDSLIWSVFRSPRFNQVLEKLDGSQLKAWVADVDAIGKTKMYLDHRQNEPFKQQALNYAYKIAEGIKAEGKTKSTIFTAEKVAARFQMTGGNEDGVKNLNATMNSYNEKVVSDKKPGNDTLEAVVRAELARKGYTEEQIKETVEKLKGDTCIVDQLSDACSMLLKSKVASQGASK